MSIYIDIISYSKMSYSLCSLRCWRNGCNPARGTRLCCSKLRCT